MKKCLICGKEIKEENGFLDNTGKIRIHFEFGSRYDSDTYKAYIHDDCYEKIADRTEFVGSRI